jgi:hypothetical protein
VRKWRTWISISSEPQFSFVDFYVHWYK